MTEGLAEKLKALREKATPGPWKTAHSDPAEGADVWWLCAGKGNMEKDLGSLVGGYPHDTHEANPALICLLVNNLNTIISALSSDKSMVMVPREPTPEMVEAGEFTVYGPDGFGVLPFKSIYRAMIAATPSLHPKGESRE